MQVSSQADRKETWRDDTNCYSCDEQNLSDAIPLQTINSRIETRERVRK